MARLKKDELCDLLPRYKVVAALAVVHFPSVKAI